MRQPRHVRGLEGPDHDRSSETHLDQRHAAEDERAQDAFAELGFGNQQRSQRLGLDGDRLHVADRARVESAHVRPSGEMSKLGHDLARHHLRHLLEGAPISSATVATGTRLPERVPENDRDAAGEDHVHRRDRLSRPAEELAVREPPDLAEPADAVDLGGERTGNIWLNRDARAPPGVTGSAGDAFSGDSGWRWSSCVGHVGHDRRGGRLDPTRTTTSGGIDTRYVARGRAVKDGSAAPSSDDQEGIAALAKEAFGVGPEIAHHPGRPSPVSESGLDPICPADRATRVLCGCGFVTA